ncbi:hypothetical protein [Pedobacter cryoconitis]|uniref:Uncharacterized protein n=1 Tax=Pedobacter cryoconitis TaxID=188932 RepID=A0A327T277_9SPHI|nr:hypothetical protein [Pedobacter cryoconitis]RAJ35359.1 hypothetical protein LY11_00602 [Pedobacter cryoconitis]
MHSHSPTFLLDPFIVNTEKITSFSPSMIEIGKKEIPIGPMYKQSVDAALR